MMGADREEVRAWLGMLREHGRRVAAVEGWTKGTLRVWLALAGHMSYGWACAFPSLTHLAARAGVSVATVRRAIRVFGGRDPIIQVQRRRRRSNLYHLDEAALRRRAGVAKFLRPLPLRRRNEWRKTPFVRITITDDGGAVLASHVIDTRAVALAFERRLDGRGYPADLDAYLAASHIANDLAAAARREAGGH